MLVCVYLSPCKSGAARSAIARHPREERGTGSPAPQARPVAHAETMPTSGQRGNQGGVFPRFSMHFWLSGSALNRPPALFAVSNGRLQRNHGRRAILLCLSAAPPVEMGAVGPYMTQLRTCAEYSRSRRRVVAPPRWSSPRGPRPVASPLRPVAFCRAGLLPAGLRQLATSPPRAAACTG